MDSPRADIDIFTLLEDSAILVAQLVNDGYDK